MEQKQKMTEKLFNKKQKKRIIILSMIVLILFLAFIGVVAQMVKENGKCVDKPFQYSAMRLKESGGNYQCSCHSLDPDTLDFIFNETGITIIGSSLYFPLPETK